VSRLKEKIRCAIIGGSLDGKTFLAAGISRGLWKFHGYRSLVFDPFKGETDWGRQAVVFGPSPKEQAAGQADEAIKREFARFRRVVSSVKPEQKFAIFWDEVTDTGGRDRSNTGMVTAARHNSDAVFLIGHSYATLLPTMRGSLSDVLLAVRDPDDAAEWSKVMVDPEVMQSTKLKKYEFMRKRKHEPIQILRYTAAQVMGGISL
jgi:hypothetical protein